MRSYRRLLVFCLKISLFLVLFALFLGFYAIPNFALRHPSRTLATTCLTFAVAGIAMMSLYGGYNIGKQKSKPIIFSMSLSALVTDLITYLQLCIMNTNENRYAQFTLADFHYLIYIFLLQVLAIVAFTYLGNYLYFKITPPEKVLIITSSQQSLDQITPKLKHYLRQYRVAHVRAYDAPDIFPMIDRCNTIFLYDVPTTQRTTLLEYCYQNQKNIYFNPELGDVVEVNSNHVLLDDKSFLSWEATDLTLEQRLLKRIMDLVISIVALVITSPIFLICAIAIKCGDGGPVFFKQNRATKYGKIFRIIKFRTMKVNVENISATTDDDRITKVGKVLRKFRVDELPQLLNILKGEMSVVGPRPEMLENVDKYTQELPEFEYRLRVKAGLTGLAQIMGKYNTTPKDKLVLDLMYIESYSLWQDIKLLLQTITVFFKADSSTEGFHTEESGMKFLNAEEQAKVLEERKKNQVMKDRG